jgi:hypothetical protein
MFPTHTILCVKVFAVSSIRMPRTVSIFAVLCALAAGAGANARAAAPTCSAHAQLGDSSVVMLTFSCTSPLTRVRVDLPPGAKPSGRPSLHVGKRATACTVERSRAVLCATSLSVGRAAAVSVGWKPQPGAGDPLLFTASGPRATVKLHLAVAILGDTDGD